MSYIKIVSLLVVSVSCVLAYPQQGHGHYEQAPVAAADHHHPEHYAHPKYEFKYAVNDIHTGDIKEQHETRDGDKVEGFYSLVEADGTRRIVHYTADDKNGFNAVVTKEGHAAHPVVKHAQPAAQYAHAPVAVAQAPIHSHQPAYAGYSSQSNGQSYGQAVAAPTNQYKHALVAVAQAPIQSHLPTQGYSSQSASQSQDYSQAIAAPTKQVQTISYEHAPVAVAPAPIHSHQPAQGYSYSSQSAGQNQGQFLAAPKNHEQQATYKHVPLAFAKAPVYTPRVAYGYSSESSGQDNFLAAPKNNVQTFASVPAPAYASKTAGEGYSQFIDVPAKQVQSTYQHASGAAPQATMHSHERPYSYSSITSGAEHGNGKH